MPDTKNALAELAERFASGTVTVKDIDCAGRIVAELAKFEPGRLLGGSLDLSSLLNLETAYENCRAIAEEEKETK